MAGRMAGMIAQRKRERQALEARESARYAAPPAHSESPRNTQRLTGALREGANQAEAGLRGAGDALTFGFYDPIAAGIEASVQPGGLQGWRTRFDANLGHEQAQDRYESAHYPEARAAGQVGGIALSLAAGGPLSGGARLAGAAGMTAREMATWLAAHGALGAGLQTATDLIEGKPASWRNDLGAATGAAAAAATGVRLPPGRAGALGGIVNSTAQDLLNGRPISLQGVADGALAGRIFGGVAGRVGHDWSNGLSREEKGQLGEQIGALRNRVNGKPTGVGPKSQDPLQGEKKYWFPDRKVGDVRYEDKFGYWATLSPNQRVAQSQLGPNFSLTHSLPSDIAKVTGIPAAVAATPRRRPQR